MSWFKRRNEELNRAHISQNQDMEGGASASPPTSLHDQYDTAPATAPSGMARRMNDSERLGYDAVMLPDHYKKFPIEPISFCQENKLDALQTAIVKYTVRFRDKNGTEDLKKAARCLDMLIAFEEGDPDWWKLPGERESRRTYIV